MSGPVLSSRQLTGVDESHLVALPCGQRMQRDAARAFALLQADARAAGFDLAIASSFRSYQRQLAIWNAKVSGQRSVYDDTGQCLDLSALSASEKLHAILRYSAIPGSSRHHWGTDVDVFDAAAIAGDYQVQLSPGEVAAGGVFDPLHCWLDERMAQQRSHGFYRPYSSDCGGVAVERWHLSYAPGAMACAGLITQQLLRECWDCQQDLLLREEIDRNLADILQRYVRVPAGWCPPQ